MYHRLTNWSDMCAMQNLFSISQFMSWYTHLHFIERHSYKMWKISTECVESAKNHRLNWIFFFHRRKTFYFAYFLFATTWIRSCAICHFWFAKVIELIRQIEPLVWHSAFRLLSSYSENDWMSEQNATIVNQAAKALIGIVRCIWHGLPFIVDQINCHKYDNCAWVCDGSQWTRLL